MIKIEGIKLVAFLVVIAMITGFAIIGIGATAGMLRAGPMIIEEKKLGNGWIKFKDDLGRSGWIEDYKCSLDCYKDFIARYKRSSQEN
jgi:hypothetical protein